MTVIHIMLLLRTERSRQQRCITDWNPSVSWEILELSGQGLFSLQSLLNLLGRLDNFLWIKAFAL